MSSRLHLKQGSTGSKSRTASSLSQLALAGVLTTYLDIRIASWVYCSCVAIAGAVEMGKGRRLKRVSKRRRRWQRGEAEERAKENKRKVGTLERTGQEQKPKRVRNAAEKGINHKEEPATKGDFLSSAE